MADAKFRINGDASDQGFDATNGVTLSLQLKNLPLAGVSTVVFQVFSATLFDDELGISRNPPRASPGAPVLSLIGATTGQSVSPAALDGVVTVDLPGSGSYSWIVRCTVNGGMATLADGRVVPDSALVHERMISIRDANNLRAIVATETTQYSDDGWAAALEELRASL
jgi:hypothetical protein